MSKSAEINKKNVIILMILIVIIAVLQVWSLNDAKKLEAKMMSKENGTSSISRLDDVQEVVLDNEVEMGSISLTESVTGTSSGSDGQARRMVDVAISQLGTKEGADGWTKYGQWYQDNIVGTQGFSTAGWCAMFVSWCANEAGIGSDIITPFASCYVGESDAESKGVWHDSSSGYVPKEGDIIFFINGSHAGIVESCSEGVVYTIEGNYSNSVSRASHHLGANDISGYASPSYR